MSRYNPDYNMPQYENNYEYNMESDMENEFTSSAFNNEEESEYEMIPGLEINDETEGENEDYEEESYESTGNYETNDEFNQYESEAYGESESAPGAYRDETEAELEYISNEDEFSNWVNEITTRDHRTRNLKPTLRSNIGRQAVRNLFSIASKTLPYLGRRIGGVRRPAFRQTGRQNYKSQFWRRPGNWNRHQHRNRNYPYWRNNPLAQPPYPYPNTDMNAFQQQPGFPGTNVPPPPPQGGFAGPDPSLSLPQQNNQDGSFKNFVLDTIKNLSQQIAAGNESITALKNSITNSAVTNLPNLVQPKSDTDTGQAPTPPPEAPAPDKQGEYSYEEENEYNNEYNNEAYEYNMETEEEGEVTDSEGSFSEETEMQLASELLSVQSESELDHFLGGLLQKAVGAVTGMLDGPQGKMLKGLLKNVVKKALPLAGAAAGTFFGGPAGTAIGSKIGNFAGGLFELELEGLSNEDREFEVARSVVRFGGNAAARLSNRFSGNPQQDVRDAVTESAMRFAPGLLTRRHHHRGYFGGYPYAVGDTGSIDSGTWRRKGNKIIIDNI